MVAHLILPGCVKTILYIVSNTAKKDYFVKMRKHIKNTILLTLFLSTCYFPAHSQLAVLKMVGKNAGNHTLGFGAFANYDIPLNDIGNQSLMIELLDFGYFPGKTPESSIEKISRGYLSIKLGFRKIFSEESKTGFFVEPQIGYCRVVVVSDQEPDARHADGVAAAVETGYSLEVGEGGNAFVFGLKYEADMAGSNYVIHAVGLRVGFNFLIYGRNR